MEHIVTRHSHGVTWITLNRPERMNALAGTMRSDFADALAEAGARSDTRVIVITGAGRAFCTGADVAVMGDLLEQRDSDTFAGYVASGSAVVRRIRELPCPVIAAVNGPAAGAGASLAVACDVRVASDQASIGFTFARIGLHPDWGATYTLPRLVGPGRAAELMLTGRMVSAAEAEQLGLFERLFPAEHFKAEVERFAMEIAAKPPLALAALKASLARSWESDLDTMLDREREAQLACFASADAREGITAFREKRSPTLTGQ